MTSAGNETEIPENCSVCRIGEDSVLTSTQENSGITGNLTVLSEPGDAVIKFDGACLGFSTPYTFKFVPAGIHEIGIRKTGFIPAYQNVTVTEGENATVRFTLEPWTGTVGEIQVNSLPSGGVVRLDGFCTGVLTPCNLTDVETGEHTVTVYHKGFDPVSENITVREGETAGVEINLEATDHPVNTSPQESNTPSYSPVNVITDFLGDILDWITTILPVARLA